MAIEIYNETYECRIDFIQKDKSGKWKKDERYKSFLDAGGEELPDSVVGGVTQDENGIIVIVDRRDIPALAHECLHAVSRMLINRGIDDIEAMNGEPFCYSLDWLMRKILEHKEENKPEPSSEK